MITYSNDAKSVIDALFGVLKAEFNDMEVVYEERFTPDYLNRSRYLRFYLSEDRGLEIVSNGEVREYDIEVAMYFNLDHLQEREDFATYTDYAERLKQLLHNNNSYAPAGSYKWHDARLTTIMYPAAIADMEDVEHYENIRGVYATAIVTRSNFWS